MTFGDYDKLPGMSHSKIKNINRKIAVVESEKMKLGTMVHKYLLEPENYENLVSGDAKMLANALRKEVQAVSKYLDKELSITADMFYKGLTMAYKGRIDWCILSRLIIDAKVFNGDNYNLRDVYYFLGYQNQLSGYGIATGATAAMIIGINAERALKDKSTTDKRKYIQKIKSPITQHWWVNQILNYGY